MQQISLVVISLFLVAAQVAPAQDDLAEERSGNQLATAIDSGSVAAVRRLLDSGTSPDTMVYGAPAIMWAVWDDRYYVAKLLVDRGADVNRCDAEGYTSLMSACGTSNLRIVKLLLDNGADVNVVERTYGMSALQSASEAGDEEIVDLLLARGADVNHLDKFGGNCLEEAAFYGNGAIVQKLRARGSTTQWPLHVACGLGDIARVRQLLSEGADARQSNAGWQNTPLHFAAGGGHVDIAEVLVEHGATLDVQNVLGAGLLHASAGADTLLFAKWLVAQGVDVNATDAEGNTPLDWAGEQMYEFLEQQGGEPGEQDADAE